LLTGAAPFEFALRRLRDGRRCFGFWLETSGAMSTQAGVPGEQFAIPYVDYLPEPGEASVDALRQVVASGDALTEVGTSSLESPSVRLAVDAVARENGWGPYSFATARIQRPDPRKALAWRIPLVLWRYSGTNPRPAGPPPSERVARIVGALASRGYSLDAWSTAAAEAAAQLAPSDARDVFATMVHPPARSAGFSPWMWIRNVQFAAAFVAAYLDGGAKRSFGKRYLRAVALGPMDWTGEAAVIALAAIARQESGSRSDVAAIYRRLFDKAPRPGHVPYEQALVVGTALIPGIAPELLRIARHTLELLQVAYPERRAWFARLDAVLFAGLL
jgi:hypothetical protein